MDGTGGTGTVFCCGFTPCLQRILEFDRLEKGAVNRARSVSVGLGGKGANTARMIVQMGGDALLAGFVGGANGRRFERLLGEEGVRFVHVETAGETRICQTLIERGNPEVTELVEEMPPPSPEEWARMRAVLERELPGAGGVVTISGRLPPGAPEEIYAEVCRLAAERGARVIIDAPGAPLLRSLPHAPALVKINDEELARTLPEAEDLPARCRGLLARGARAVLITRGARSAFFFTADGTALELFPPEIEAVNPVGSGDAVTAGTALSLLRGEPLDEAVMTGLAWGASNALHLACGVVEPEEIAALRPRVRARAIPARPPR